MRSASYRPLGYLQSCFKENFGVPRQGGLIEEARSRLTLENWCQPQAALEGLSSFSHVWILSSFHNLGEFKYSPKIRPPRLNGEKVGVFASRSPHRPNPIGLSVARLEKIEDATVWLRGLDLVDGTPILDLKPYIAEYDVLHESSSGWLTKASDSRLQVEVAGTFERDLEQFYRESELPSWGMTTEDFTKLATRVVELDPRPSTAKQLGPSTPDGSQAQRFGCNLHGLDVQFVMTSANQAIITGIKGSSASTAIES